MFLAIACLFASAAAVPIHYDQRQTGDVNAQVDISNVILVFAIPKKIPSSLFDLFSKSDKPEEIDTYRETQERANARIVEAFVEPNTPYHVEIGTEEKTEEGDGRGVEVVIAGRRRLETEPELQDDGLKLLGAIENCGPNRTRDAITLRCKDVQLIENNSDTEVPQTEQRDDIDYKTIPEVVSS